MKCNCGGEGDLVIRRVDLKRKYKNYRVTTYKCNECQLEFYLGRIFVHK